MEKSDIRKIEDVFKHQLGIFAEDVQHKFDLVIEGQQMLAERMDRLEVRTENLEALGEKHSGQLNGIASDLAAHRQDTEAHRRGYQIRED